MVQELNASEEIDLAEVRAALERVTAEPAFAKSQQLTKFLRYVVEETLAGRGGRLKAYTIATSAFGRDENFDPLVDPIVRVEAGRLRHALQNYYADDGRHDRIMIELPVGSYMPVFRLNDRGLRVGNRVRRVWLQTVQLARDNKRLIALVIVVAATLSLLFDFVEMLLTKRG